MEGFILLNPAPSSKDYTFNMDKNEGLTDMLDIVIDNSYWKNKN